MEQKLSFKHILSALDDYDLFLFDMWGVIIEGDLIYPGVIDTINKIMQKKKTFFVTNAPRPGFQVRDNLEKWGISGATNDLVFTSGDMAIEIIKNTLNGVMPIIYHLGKDRNPNILLDFDHIPTSDLDKANVVLVSLYRDDHENITEFNDLLAEIAKKNILTICSNPDATIPLQGKIRYHAGYFSSIIEQNGGKVIYSGKPKSIIYDAVFEKAGNIPLNRILMVGDTFETDILGANKAGIHSALVLTGNAEKFHHTHHSLEDKIAAISLHSNALGIKPTFITTLK